MTKNMLIKEDKRDLTIFMPTWNRASILSKNLPLILGSIEASSLYTSNKVKFIVSNNASSDETSHFLQSVFENFPWIQVVNQDINIEFEGQLDFIANIVNTTHLWILGDDDSIIGDLSSISEYLECANSAIFIPHHSTKLAYKTLPNVLCVEDFLVSYKGGFQFISSWIVPSAHFVTWLQVASRERLEDPQCLINLAALSTLRIIISDKLSISPLPSIKEYNTNPIYTTFNVFWARPRAALRILSATNPIHSNKLAAYRRWEDVQLLKFLYLSISRKPLVLAQSDLQESRAYCNFFSTSILVAAMSRVPLIYVRWIFWFYGKVKILPVSLFRIMAKP
jgi:hypothetical protein